MQTRSSKFLVPPNDNNYGVTFDKGYLPGLCLTVLRVYRCRRGRPAKLELKREARRFWSLSYHCREKSATAWQVQHEAVFGLATSCTRNWSSGALSEEGNGVFVVHDGRIFVCVPSLENL